jgi:hypothetical protein
MPRPLPAKLEKKSRGGGPARDLELEVIEYVGLVRQACEEYGEDPVLNMDETPVALCDAPGPRTGIVRTGSNRPALIHTTYLQASFLTVFPTITASGKKLPLGSILKGKTSKCLEKIRVGASAATSRVHLDYTTRSAAR